ncbi:MAG: hypothetical protein EOO04_28875, partial [Chitinophagaceae bacterium]
MKSPFRNSIRIAVVLLAGVLLFNFFSYYAMRIRSGDSEKMVSFVNQAANQRALSRSITTDALLIINGDNNHTEQKNFRRQLAENIDSFVLNKDRLRSSFTLPDIDREKADEILGLLSKSNLAFEKLVKTAREVNSLDSTT